MSKNYIEGKEFKGIDYSVLEFSFGDYEDCIFTNCKFVSVDISEINFFTCEFVDCDFSLSNIEKVGFRDVKFKNCKLLGLRFDLCNNFVVKLNFENCILDFSSFYKLKIPNTIFKNCKLNEVDFVETNLSNSTFDECDFSRAVFEDTNLQNVDFRTSTNYIINPENNKMKGAKFLSTNLKGLLDKYNLEIE